MGLLNSQQCKAVLAVNYFGFAQELAPFREYCLRTGATLIEDNAHGFLSKDTSGVLLGMRTGLGITSIRKTFRLVNGAALFFSGDEYSGLVAEQLEFQNEAAPMGFLLRKVSAQIQRSTKIPTLSLFQFTTVLHVRGFDVEKPDSYEKKGWRELNANRIYDELLYNLNSGDKVAIVGRFPEKVANFTSTLLGHGLEVRSITNHSGVQDFCFLKSATKEIIGGVKSTFFRIAALLNDSVSKVTIYCLHQPSQLDCKHHYASTFTHEKQTRKEWNFPIIY